MSNLKKLIFSYPLLVLFILVSSCKGYKITDIKSLNINAEKNINQYEFNELELAVYRDSISSEMNKVINYSKINMSVGCPEGLLGNFITDLSLLYIKKELSDEKLNPDFCVLNNGGFRSSLNKGPVHIGDVFQIMPFENYLVILEIHGDKMERLLNYIHEKSFYNGSRKSGVPLSGLRMKISSEKINRCFINTKAYDSAKIYKVLTTNYLANGGDQMDFFNDCKLIYNTELLLRDVIINYIEETGKNNIKLNAQLDGRIQILQ
tara:strand:- start:986 stop:1774 length:789 start_codon:yes stop_codon:yes gene_type:complete